MSTRHIPRPFFLALVAFAVVLAAFVALVLFDSSVVRLVTTLVALGATGFVATLISRLVFSDQPDNRSTAASKLPCPDHLRLTSTQRGFSQFPALSNQYGGPEDISVSESSNASYAGIWLGVAGLGEQGEHTKATANLTAATAWRLAEQLAVATHYHGDRRPEPADTVLSVDLSRLDVPEAVEA